MGEQTNVVTMLLLVMLGHQGYDSRDREQETTCKDIERGWSPPWQAGICWTSRLESLAPTSTGMFPGYIWHSVVLLLPLLMHTGKLQFLDFLFLARNIQRKIIALIIFFPDKNKGTTITSQTNMNTQRDTAKKVMGE